MSVRARPIPFRLGELMLIYKKCRIVSVMEKPSQPLKLTAPTQRPPEIQALFDAKELLIPVLIWCSSTSHISPCATHSEHAYSCLGYFFISELRVRAMESLIVLSRLTIHFFRRKL